MAANGSKTTLNSRTLFLGVGSLIAFGGVVLVIINIFAPAQAAEANNWILALGGSVGILMVMLQNQMALEKAEAARVAAAHAATVASETKEQLAVVAVVAVETKEQLVEVKEKAETAAVTAAEIKEAAKKAAAQTDGMLSKLHDQVEEANRALRIATDAAARSEGAEVGRQQAISEAVTLATAAQIQSLIAAATPTTTATAPAGTEPVPVVIQQGQEGLPVVVTQEKDLPKDQQE